jgi:excisionase family DNA binding protein
VGEAQERRVQFRERAKSPRRSRARGGQSLGQRTNARADLGHGQSPPGNLCRRSRFQEAADLLGVHYFSVYRLVQRGKLRACRVLSGKLLIPRSELERLLKT